MDAIVLSDDDDEVPLTVRRRKLGNRIAVILDET